MTEAAELTSRIFENHACIWSEELRSELISVLRQKSYYDTDIALTVQEFADLCEFVVPAALSAPVYRDRDDDIVLATALAGQADYIVTGDDDLLSLKNHQGIRIVTPREFWNIITA